MFHELVDEAAASDRPNADEERIEAATLLASFETLLTETVEEVGSDRVVSETPLDPSAVKRIAEGDARTVTLAEGAALLATGSDREAESMVAELRDHLLMGMATAVLDVDTIAASIDADLTGQEVQQVLEGRAAMTLEQLADVMAVIETRKR